MRTLVAGSEGMIGRNVVKILGTQGTGVRRVDFKSGTDLRSPVECMAAVTDCDAVFHLADHTAGLGYAKNHHGEMLTNSLLVSLNLLRAARKAHVSDYLYVSSSCVYADHYQNEPVPEYYADQYIPEQVNEGYGWAKRIAEKQCRYFYMEYDLRTIIARPANVYGPSYDWSRPVEEMHVIPSLIMKMLRGDKEITVWGTGKQRRTFMYEADAAKLMVELMEHGHGGEAYNLGGTEYQIRNMAEEIAMFCGYKGTLIYDTSKPQGPDRKAQDTSKLEQIVSIPQTTLTTGLRETIEAARKALLSFLS